MLLLNKTLIRMSKGLWGWILAITSLKMLTLVLTVRFARIIAGFLGNLYSPQITVLDAGNSITRAFLMAALIFVSELVTGEAEHRCTAKARIVLRGEIFSKALRLDVGNIEEIGPVSAITSSVDAVESIQVYYSKYLPGLIYCMIAPFYLYVRLRPLSAPVAIVLLVVSLAVVPINNVFRKKIQDLQVDYWDGLEDLTGYYLESVQGLTTLKLYGQDEERRNILKEKSYDLNSRVMRVMRLNFSSFFLSDGMVYSAIVVAVLIDLYQLMRGYIDIPSAMTILLLSYSFFSSLRQLMNATHSALTGIAAAEKVEKLLSIDTTRPYNPDIPMQEDLFEGIKLKNVSYSYKGRDSAVQGVNIEIQKGKVTAFVGMSGCGKSTVAGLLMKFFDPAEGKIFIEGRDYESLTPRQIRKKVIMVPQTVSLFSGTVAENLRLAAPDATDRDLMEVLREVKLSEWIESQPLGLETSVGDAGGKLSGGQRQKIGIARALLCKAEYIIFDEATSSVDMDSEREIWNCIDNLAETRTLIIISHRLSTIAKADRIYVMENGKVTDSGNHDFLMSRSGIYKTLTEEQAVLEKRGNGGLLNAQKI